MLGIYAKTFMTATRQRKSEDSTLPLDTLNKQRWLPSGHWYLETDRPSNSTKL